MKKTYREQLIEIKFKLSEVQHLYVKVLEEAAKEKSNRTRAFDEALADARANLQRGDAHLKEKV